MPLQTEVLRNSLKEKIKQALDLPFDEKTTSEEIKTTLANNIANAVADGVDSWIRTGTVTVQPGIPVTTSSGSGTTTGTGTGSIS